MEHPENAPDTIGIWFRTNGRMRARSFRILVVEDDPLISDLLKNILTRLGQKVEVAGNGQEAIRLFALKPYYYEIIVTDHTMPCVDGLELVSHLRKNDFEGRIIVISGSLTGELINAYKAKRVDKILQKPFVPAELSFTLNVFLTQWSQAGSQKEHVSRS